MPTISSFAVLADVHGNSWALEAVLADVRRRAVGRIINLGDNVYGPLDPAGTADLLIEQEIVGVLGNQDRALLAPSATSPAPAVAVRNGRADWAQWLCSGRASAV